MLDVESGGVWADLGWSSTSESMSREPRREFISKLSSSWAI